MADFKTHIATSTLVGIAYGGYGFYAGASPQSCILAGGLCSVAGMLPDLDSESGAPVREMSAFAAAVIPMLMLERFESFGWSREMIACCSAIIYVLVRFGLPAIFRRYTVHRGMWHSIPACLLCGLITFLLVAGPDMNVRLFKAGGVVLGFMTHLILDEIWSFGLRGGRLNVKRSFGTAIKFFGKDRLANSFVWGKLLVCSLLSVGDPMLMQRYGTEVRFGDKSPQEFLDRALEMAGMHRPHQPNESINR